MYIYVYINVNLLSHSLREIDSRRRGAIVIIIIIIIIILIIIIIITLIIITMIVIIIIIIIVIKIIVVVQIIMVTIILIIRVPVSWTSRRCPRQRPFDIAGAGEGSAPPSAAIEIPGARARAQRPSARAPWLEGQRRGSQGRGFEHRSK